MAGSISFIFDEGKAAEAASYILSLNGGSMNYMKMIKLLYIADRVSLSRYFYPITTDCYFSLKLGPVPSNILDCITYADERESNTPWNETIERCGYDVKQKKPFRQYFTSMEELDTLREVYDSYKKYDQFNLSEISHKFPEWSDPGNSRKPISIEDILQATIEDDKTREEAIKQLQMTSHLKNMSYLNLQELMGAKN